MPTRYDTNKIGRVIKRPNGHLLVPATLARVGVQSYRNADGSVRRELRLPDEVFNEDAMASLELVPVTVDHPPVMLDGTNTARYAKGAVGENISRDGNFVKARLAVTDADAIAKVEAGEKAEISVGYTCDLEMTSGTWNGQPYDAIQRNIRANHVSLVSKGRAGSDVRVHLDAAESIADDENNAPAAPKENTVKVTINGKEFDVSDEAAAALNAERADAEQAVSKATAEVKAELDKATARADALDAQLTAAKAERMDAKAINEAVKARVDLQTKVLKIVKKIDAIEDQTDRQLMCLAIEAVTPAVKSKLEKASDAYIAAAFDMAVAAPHPSLSGTREETLRADGQNTDAEEKAAQARAKFMLEQATSHLRPVNLKG